MNICWCGNSDLKPFSHEYRVCKACETLVSNYKETSLNQDSKDSSLFYGEDYWVEHQKNDLNQPDITVRARTDLSERNLHWLKTVLKFALPPKKTLELGCSHGSFSALLKHIGYNAKGLEIDSWVVDFAKKRFDIPMFLGAIEDIDFQDEKFDLIIMNDVFEHLPDPITTIKKCLNVLENNGLFVMQMPCFPHELKAEDILNASHPFFRMLLPEEHVHLFSKQGIQQFFSKIGVHYLQFEVPIFSTYDMYLVASRTPFVINTQAEIEAMLLSTVNGQIIQALLDLSEFSQKYVTLYQQADEDRVARLHQLENLSLGLKESKKIFGFIETARLKVNQATSKLRLRK